MENYISVLAGNALSRENGISKNAKLLKIPVTKPNCKSWSLFPYQEEIIDCWSKNHNFLCISPTGSGKSLMMSSMAAINYENNISTFILVPKIVIAQGFSHTNDRNFEVKIKGKSHRLNIGEIRMAIPTMVRSDTSSIEVEKALEEAFLGNVPVVQVACYQSFVKAYDNVRAKYPDLDPNKINALFDEAHHVNLSDSPNVLGKHVKKLMSDGVPISKFTATGYRANGAPMSDGYFFKYRRTLKQQHDDDEKLCPDLNVHFRFFDDVDFNKHIDTTGVDSISLDNPEKLITAYVEEYAKDQTSQVIMYIPSTINNGAVSAAELATKLEAKLRNINNNINIINFASCENSQFDIDLISKNKTKYDEIRNQFEQNKDNSKIDVIISIKIMDEGVDWPDCDKIFMARIPQSLPLIVQRIGRMMRKKNELWYKRSENRKYESSVYFFELNVKSNDNRITLPMIKIACRLNCLFKGFEFNNIFAFTTGPKKRISDISEQLINIDDNILSNINKKLQKLCLYCNNPRKIIKNLLKEYATIGVKLTNQEALSMAINNGLISKLDNDSEKYVKSFVNRMKNKSLTFEQFCADPTIKKILDGMLVVGPRDYLKMLSSNTDLDIAMAKLNDSYRIDLLKLQPNSDKPLRTSKDPKTVGMANAFYYYTNKDSYGFDIDVFNELKENQPHWFEEKIDYISELLKFPANFPKLDRKSKDVHIRKLVRAIDRIKRIINPSDDIQLLKQKQSIWFETKTNYRNMLMELPPNSKKPTMTSKDPNIRGMSIALYNYTSVNSRLYDVDYALAIKNNQPQWFKPRINYIDEIMKLPSNSIKPSKRSTDPYIKGLACALDRLSRRSGVYYSDRLMKLKKQQPHWFKRRISYKEMLLNLPPNSKKPSERSKDPDIIGMARALYTYTSINSRSYDVNYVSKLKERQPHWFNK